MAKTVSSEPHIRQLQEAIEAVVLGKPEAVKLSLVCLLAEGHLLIEDVPGVGKTTLARSIARVFPSPANRRVPSILRASE